MDVNKYCMVMSRMIAKISNYVLRLFYIKQILFFILTIYMIPNLLIILQSIKQKTTAIQQTKVQICRQIIS